MPHKNIEDKKRQGKQYYLDNRERILERIKLYQKNNSEKIKKYNKEYWKKYYKNNREQLLKKNREWRSKNNQNEYMKQWRLKNPEKVKEICKRCYEKKINLL